MWVSGESLAGDQVEGLNRTNSNSPEPRLAIFSILVHPLRHDFSDCVSFFCGQDFTGIMLGVVTTTSHGSAFSAAAAAQPEVQRAAGAAALQLHWQLNLAPADEGRGHRRYDAYMCMMPLGFANTKAR